MGRPLKIAKAQAVITITATNGTTEVVTTSSNLTTLGIIAGMPFIPATTVGGLTGGTTYWILQVLSDTTFTASLTPLNANPDYTPVNLTNAGPVTVAATVGLVNSGFNNPQGTANTYGIVGGNTALFGDQVLANIAIGRNGTGVLYANTASTTVFGVGTDLSNTVVANSYVQLVNTDGSVVDLGRVDTLTGFVTVEVANTATTGNIIGTTGNAQTLIVDGPVRFTANLGGLVAGTTYFVKAIANAAAFTVSSTQGGAEVALSNATGTPDAQQDSIELSASALANAAGASFAYANPEAGYIVRQKGKTKYLVTGVTSGLTAQCYTANVANTALLPNTMSVIGTYANAATVYVQSLSDYNSEVFPATVAAGALSGGTVYTIESVGTTDWTAVGAYANMTGITFVATGAGSGTGTAVVSTVDPDVVGTFNTAEAANTANGLLNPVIEINKG